MGPVKHAGPVRLRRARAAFRRLGLTPDHYNRELGDQCGNGSDGGQQWSQYRSNGGYRHRNLHERIPVLVFHDDSLHVSFVDQLAYLVHEITAEYMNFLNKVLELHIHRLRRR